MNDTGRCTEIQRDLGITSDSLALQKYLTTSRCLPASAQRAVEKRHSKVLVAQCFNQYELRVE